jgi:hypothetical protein
MNPGKRFHNEFNLLMEEENEIVRQRVSPDCCYLNYAQNCGRRGLMALNLAATRGQGVFVSNVVSLRSSGGETPMHGHTFESNVC